MPTKVILTCILIFLSRICDVTLMSIRTIFLTKGMAKRAMIIGFFEVSVYMSVLGKMMSVIDQPQYFLAYCFGFATGIFVGAKIEQKLAFGDAQMRAILPIENKNIIDELRDMGFGVTSFIGEGKDGERLMILINLKRKRIGEVYDYFTKNDIPAFVSTNDITSYKGGYQESATLKSNFMKSLRK